MLSLLLGSTVFLGFLLVRKGFDERLVRERLLFVKAEISRNRDFALDYFKFLKVKDWHVVGNPEDDFVSIFRNQVRLVVSLMVPYKS